MIDNMPVIEQTGTLEHFTERDREMLNVYGRPISVSLCKVLRHGQAESTPVHQL